uniref:CCT domain-containing protein n=1 Tax=Aplanochytrium stocchinoi TaxID=215587 RepID=A0A7S3V065_9STRA|mmetsp:Transcript_24389/g.29779  ORF Transcript_24389/g.29779 Transcript_24389/m.29779 type:complete len:300 (+) Transcript_24389:297-1196(+)|eukprot:CAMPEP_0204828970 /NCGR_PEP_ID=MMETSP1346-20131115/6943_1 /ASSEMBLY_ACC=CAM_ASM_000771 /TAXON_ID=215587 /ORGANISM="Aplanochytrium stocchinoi, Strain GSBS06" /LENGTH=299 /DNA_ID=CAMNT_0051958403 /DNA_START=243 /DNA_END=1142 /DNA_ORIENTATION=+
MFEKATSLSYCSRTDIGSGMNSMSMQQSQRETADAEAARALFFLHTSPIQAGMKSNAMNTVPELSLSQEQVKAENGLQQQQTRSLAMKRGFLNGFSCTKGGSSILSSSAPAAGAAGTLCSLMAIAEAGRQMQQNDVKMEDHKYHNSKENYNGDGIYSNNNNYGYNMATRTERNRARALSLMSLDSEYNNNSNGYNNNNNNPNGLRERRHSVYSVQSEPGSNLSINERINPNGKMIGAYSPASRRKLLDRFLEKRRNRIWKKRIKYGVRKNFADSRLRVKGRFVRKEDEEQLRDYLLMTV